jgi:hypothetical protein
MPDFVLDYALFKRAAKRNNYPLSDSPLIFFGVRGALPLDISGTPFAKTHPMRVTDPDHQLMRCTLGQMRSSDETLAVFPGSTVPTLKYVKASIARGGEGVNTLMLGKYAYIRGTHKNGKPTGHRAFVQAMFFPVWRTADDADYDLEDRLDNDGGIVADNLHCAYHDNLATPGYSSAGCQVIAGRPSMPANGNLPESGPWKRFVENAYGAGQPLQKSYTYYLFSGSELAMVALKPDADLIQSARFGSEGTLVKEVQKALKAKGYPLGTANGKFDRDTLEAVMRFQTSYFGKGQADGIVGGNTGAALGLQMPSL